MGVFFKLYNMTNYNLDTNNKSIGGGINEIKETTPTVVLNNGEAELFSSQSEGVINGSLNELQFAAVKEVIERKAQVIINIVETSGYITVYQSVTQSLHPDGGMSVLYFDYNDTTHEVFSKLWLIDADRTCQVITKKLTQ